MFHKFVLLMVFLSSINSFAVEPVTGQYNSVFEFLDVMEADAYDLVWGMGAIKSYDRAKEAISPTSNECELNFKQAGDAIEQLKDFSQSLPKEVTTSDLGNFYGKSCVPAASPFVQTVGDLSDSALKICLDTFGYENCDINYIEYTPFHKNCGIRVTAVPTKNTGGLLQKSKEAIKLLTKAQNLHLNQKCQEAVRLVKKARQILQ
jgi:hypothetical protein